MDFSLTEEQTAVRDLARKILDEHFADTPPEVRDRIVRDNVRELYRF